MAAAAKHSKSITCDEMWKLHFLPKKDYQTTKVLWCPYTTINEQPIFGEWGGKCQRWGIIALKHNEPVCSDQSVYSRHIRS